MICKASRESCSLDLQSFNLRVFKSSDFQSLYLQGFTASVYLIFPQNEGVRPLYIEFSWILHGLEPSCFWAKTIGLGLVSNLFSGIIFYHGLELGWDFGLEQLHLLGPIQFRILGRVGLLAKLLILVQA